MRFLVVGWFSVEDGAATAGDLLTRDLACEWITSAGYAYDVALAPPFRGGVDIYTVDPNNYSHLVFVCGPFQPRWFAATLCRRFGRCRLIGLNVSMHVPLEAWNPFDGLIERDSSVSAKADMAFLSVKPLVPVVGVCLVEPYEGAIDHVANAAIEGFLATREVSVVPIDTRLDVNSEGLRTPAEIESLFARMDVVITTRLHGTVLALKNGVPVIAIDPEAGGAKVRRQAETIGWPVIFNADDVTDQALQEAFDYCLSDAARVEARNCAKRGKKMVEEIRNEFITMLMDPQELDARYFARINAPNNEEWILALERGGAKKTTSRSTMRWIRRFLNRAARWTLPSPVYRWLRDTPPAGSIQFGDLRRVAPIDRHWGWRRGTPVDRYYIEKFLLVHASDIRGRVLEIGDDAYTRKFGGDRAAISDVLHVAEGNPQATFVGDLTDADHIPSNLFDCIILTQTLQLIYDVPAALKTLHRILKPGGVLLATFPGISQIADKTWGDSWCWNFTPLSARRLFGEVFPSAGVKVEARGNVLAAIAFLHGIATQELREDELDYADPGYPVTITARAVKPEAT